MYTQIYNTVFSKSEFQLSVLQPNPNWSQLPIIEHFSIEYRKTKSKVMTTANKKKGHHDY